MTHLKIDDTADGPQVLIAGATGRVGREILSLLPPELWVRAGVRAPEKCDASQSANVEYIRLDFNDSGTFVPALAGMRRVFLMWPSISIELLYRFIDMAAQCQVEHIVFLSIFKADKLHIVPHRKIERRLEASPMRYTFLRAGYFMQNLSSIHAADIRKYDEIFIPAGQGQTAFVDARDVASVAVKALTEPGHENRAYNLTGSQALTFDEAAAMLGNVLGRSIRYTSPSL